MPTTALSPAFSAVSRRNTKTAFSGIPKRLRSAWQRPSSCVSLLMATMLLPPEFKRLLSGLASNKVEYLIVGGYAVIYHGYVSFISLPDLKVNKRSSARNKDLADLDYLP